MAKSKQPKLADVLRLGAELAQTKASMNPKTWRKLVNTAHKRGFTIGGYLSGVPDSLKERLPASIQAEAQRNVNSIYAPVFSSLDSQERQINALAEKRKNDNAAYQEWLNNQYTKIEEQSKAADNALVARQQQVQQASRAGWDTAEAQAYANAASTAGNVSDPNSSTALAQIRPGAQMSDDLIASARRQSSDIIAANDQLAADARGSALAMAALMEAQRSSDQWKSLGEVRDERSKASKEKGAAFVQEKGRLQGIDRENAMSNREYSAAAQKLGIESEKLRQDAIKDQRNYNLEVKKFKFDQWTAKNKAATEQAKIMLGYDEIEAQNGRAAADRRLQKWLRNEQNRQKALDRASKEDIAAKNRRAASKAGQTDSAKKTSQDLYGKVTSMASDARAAGARKGASQEVIAKARKSLKDAGVSGPYLNIAMDLAVFGKLSAPNVAAAKRLGILDPGKIRY